MEYCHCGSIASYLRRGNRLNEEELRAIASCCLLGLSYLHKRNVAHRVFIIAFLWVIGYQTRQLASLWSGSGETGWFRTGEWTGRIVHETTGCVWYFTVHGTRSVRRRRCVEEWCVVVGNQFDRNGRGQESLRWSFSNDDNERSIDSTTAFSLALQMVFRIRGFRESVFGEGRGVSWFSGRVDGSEMSVLCWRLASVCEWVCEEIDRSR